MELNLFWLSRKTGRTEQVFAKELTQAQLADHVKGIFYGRGNWDELRTLVEKHEGVSIKVSSYSYRIVDHRVDLYVTFDYGDPLPELQTGRLLV